MSRHLKGSDATLAKRMAGAAATGMAMLIGTGLSGSPARAAYIVTLVQEGSDVVQTGSGAGTLQRPLAALPLGVVTLARRTAADVSHRPRGSASSYLCSLGTNTVLGNVTNGLLVVLLDGGAEN